MSQKSPSVKYWIPAAAWAALLFVLSSLPSQSVPSLGIEYEDLVLHFLVYSVLGYCLGIALLHDPERANLEMAIVAVLLGVLYGASDEFHQMFVPGRFSTISDFLADGVGVVLGVLAFRKFPALFRFLDRRFLA